MPVRSARAGMRSCRCSCSQAGFGNECCVERAIISLLHINSHQQVGLLEGTFSERLNRELSYCRWGCALLGHWKIPRGSGRCVVAQRVLPMLWVPRWRRWFCLVHLSRTQHVAGAVRKGVWSCWRPSTSWWKSVRKSPREAERWLLQHKALVVCVNGVGGREEPLRLLVFATARWLHDKQLDKVLKS